VSAASRNVEPSGDATAVIRSQCAKEWPDDFRMRAHCEEQQREGLAKVNSRVINTDDMRTIRRVCAKEWPADFRMQNHCEEQQIEALRKLGR
jgi:hypothetical protein